MSLAKRKVTFTYQDLLNWEDDNFRHEILEGDHVITRSPSTYHQEILINLATYLKTFVDEYGLGKILTAPTDVLFSDFDVLVPDILFISDNRRDIIKENFIAGAPDLVVEILSQSTAKRDKEVKYKRYARYGVKEYWIVDPDQKSIAVHDLDKMKLISEKKLGEQLSSRLLPGLKLDLEKVF